MNMNFNDIRARAWDLRRDFEYGLGRCLGDETLRFQVHPETYAEILASDNHRYLGFGPAPKLLGLELERAACVKPGKLRIACVFETELKNESAPRT